MTTGQTSLIEAQDEAGSESPSRLIDAKIAAVGGWRGERLAWARAVIRAADPEVVETVKWRKPTNPSGVPVWEHAGIICTGETYKSVVKLTFARAPPWTTHQACSIRASTATPDGPSTSMRARRSMRRR